LIQKVFLVSALSTALFCTSIIAHSQSLVTKHRAADKTFSKDVLKVKPLDPQFSNFPDASLEDFSFLLDAPAGKSGFVKVGSDGHFHFTKTNKRIRFFGITIAASNVDVSHKRIDEVLDVLARAGCNLVRFHELDNRGGEKFNLLRRNIIDESYPHEKDSQHFDKEYLDRLDYWIAGAKKRGIYLYLVVRGYRTFKTDDKVPAANQMDRKGSPYSLFDDHMIELQLKYIDDFLFKHVNPYTKLPYGLDPAIAMIELINEDSFFFHPDLWLKLVEPYRTELENKWNAFLKNKYKSDSLFRSAYESNLLSGEKLGVVRLPDINDSADAVLHSGKRLKDAAEFAASLQAELFNRMKMLIRKRGCPIPLTVTVNSLNKFDTYTVAQNLDFIGQNAYLDHPSFAPGEEWKGVPSFSNKNYLKETGPYSLQAYTAHYAWYGKPIVIREWATCWPNRYRVSSMLQIATDATLQDYDALIYFSYYTAGDVNVISPFGMQSDPTQWGMFPYAAKLFISGDVSPMKNIFEFIYTYDQLIGWEEKIEPQFKLAFSGKVRVCVDSGSNDAVKIWTVSEGKFPKLQENSIVRLDTTSVKASLVIKRILTTLELDLKSFDSTAVKQRGCQPIHIGSSYVGFYVLQKKVAILLSKDADDLIEVAKRMSFGIVSRSAMLPHNSKGFTSSGEVQFDTMNGTLFICAPEFESAAGEFIPYKPYSLNTFKYTPSTSISAFAVTSLDGNRLKNSSKFIFKIATTAHNRGEKLVPINPGTAAGGFALVNNGLYPIQTDGIAVDAPAIVTRNNQKIVEAYLRNGTIEFLLNERLKQAFLFCDSRNIRFSLDRKLVGRDKIRLERFYQESAPNLPIASGIGFIYPAYSKYLKITW